MYNRVIFKLSQDDFNFMLTNYVEIEYILKIIKDGEQVIKQNIFFKYSFKDFINIPSFYRALLNKYEEFLYGTYIYFPICINLNINHRLDNMRFWAENTKMSMKKINSETSVIYSETPLVELI